MQLGLDQSERHPKVWKSIRILPSSVYAVKLQPSKTDEAKRFYTIVTIIGDWKEIGATGSTVAPIFLWRMAVNCIKYLSPA